jgi:hypothetical protein
MGAVSNRWKLSSEFALLSFLCFIPANVALQINLCIFSKFQYCTVNDSAAPISECIAAMLILLVAWN